MGLTVHYHLTAPAGTDVFQAGRLVASAHRIAARFVRAGRFDTVTPPSAEAGLIKRDAVEYLSVPVPGERNAFLGLEVKPRSGWMFLVAVGRDCEPLRVGLCHYPDTVKFQGRHLPTKLGGGWRFAGFSKTQYASLHGWEHFLRCHRAVIDLLAALRPLGFRVRINDEGEYWPRRSITALRRNVGQMNALVAGAAGALKDMEDGEGVESPIFAHRDFERLEAEGARDAGEVLTVLPAIVEAAGNFTRPVRRNP